MTLSEPDQQHRAFFSYRGPNTTCRYFMDCGERYSRLPSPIQTPCPKKHRALFPEPTETGTNACHCSFLFAPACTGVRERWQAYAAASSSFVKRYFLSWLGAPSKCGASVCPPHVWQNAWSVAECLLHMTSRLIG